MKFQPGDYVRYSTETCIREDFVKQYGRGPFIFERYHDNDLTCYLLTVDGRRMIMNERRAKNDENTWNHTVSDLREDVFLTAARKAIAHEAKV